MCNSIYWNPEIFQSTRPGWGEAVVPFLPFRHLVISIHSPRVGRGARRSPTAGARSFQSTRPGWGEARNTCPTCALSTNFNPLAPGGARQPLRVYQRPRFVFQSTRPGWGEASRLRAVMASLALFQSTRPGWGEAIYQGTRQGRTGHFNPLAPGGARRSPRRWRHSCRYFNPLAPGGARPYAAIFSMGDSFYFNPLAPGGARRGCDRKALDCRPFQSTRPGWGEARRFLGHGV